MHSPNSSPPPSANFSYPFGDVTPAIKKTLGPKLASSRSIFPGLNGPEIDLNLLKANSLYGGSDGASAENALASAKKLIAENAAQKSWLIFYTHDVQPQPSPYGCTPDLLRSVVSYAAASSGRGAASQNGTRILTIQDALTALGAPTIAPVESSRTSRTPADMAAFPTTSEDSKVQVYSPVGS